MADLQQSLELVVSTQAQVMLGIVGHAADLSSRCGPGQLGALQRLLPLSAAACLPESASCLPACPLARLQLRQLQGVSKALLEELASSAGAGPTPSLRELLATGERLVAAIAEARVQPEPW